MGPALALGRGAGSSGRRGCHRFLPVSAGGWWPVCLRHRRHLYHHVGGPEPGGAWGVGRDPLRVQFIHFHYYLAASAGSYLRFGRNRRADPIAPERGAGRSHPSGGLCDPQESGTAARASGGCAWGCSVPGPAPRHNFLGDGTYSSDRHFHPLRVRCGPRSG